MTFKLHNKTETYKEVFDTFCKNSNDLEIVCSDGRKVSFKSYLLYFYSLNNLEVFTKSSTIFMEDDFETITLLRDLLTSGEGHAEGNPRQTIVKLVAAADSLNINLTENFDIKNYNMNFTDFISGIDEIMKDSYEVSESSQRDYNMSTGEFINKVDRIFTSTMKKDELQFVLDTNQGFIDASLNKEEQEYQCRFCDKSFTSNKILKRHSLCHTQYSCTICGKGFRMQSLLTWHKKNEHGNSAVSSNLKSFDNSSSDDKSNVDSTQDSGDIHVVSESSGLESFNESFLTDEKQQLEVLQCTFCDKTFTSKKLFKRHRLFHTQYSCKLCGKGFRMQSLLTWHEKNEHGNSVVINSSMLKSFDSSAFNMKSIVESSQHCFKCEICGKGFKMSSLLARHWRMDHDVKLHCQPCNKSFENDSLLRKHKLTKHSIISTMRLSFKARVINQIEF